MCTGPTFYSLLFIVFFFLFLLQWCRDVGKIRSNCAYFSNVANVHLIGHSTFLSIKSKNKWISKWLEMIWLNFHGTFMMDSRFSILKSTDKVHLVVELNFGLSLATHNGYAAMPKPHTHSIQYRRTWYECTIQSLCYTRTHPNEWTRARVCVW